MKTFYKRADNTLAEVTVISEGKDKCYVSLNKTNRAGENHYLFYAEKKYLIQKKEIKMYTNIYEELRAQSQVTNSSVIFFSNRFILCQDNHRDSVSLDIGSEEIRTNDNRVYKGEDNIFFFLRWLSYTSKNSKI